MQQCKYCGKYCSKDDFETAGVIKGKRYYRLKCKVCRRKDKKKLGKRNARWLREYKSSLECEVCGYNRHYAALDFHHTNPDTKEHDVADMVRTGYSIESIMDEIEKCTVLCANCHRIEHHA